MVGQLTVKFEMLNQVKDCGHRAEPFAVRTVRDELSVQAPFILARARSLCEQLNLDRGLPLDLGDPDSYVRAVTVSDFDDASGFSPHDVDHESSRLRLPSDATEFMNSRTRSIVRRFGQRPAWRS